MLVVLRSSEVERRPSKSKVPGSSPRGSCIIIFYNFKEIKYLTTIWGVSFYYNVINYAT